MSSSSGVLDLTDSPPKKARKKLVRKDAPKAKISKKKPTAVSDDVFRRMMKASEPEPAVPWPSSPDWPGVVAMCRELGIQHITAVDPGEVNLGAVRFQLYPEFKPTHWKIIDIHELCDLRNKSHPAIQIGHSTVVKGKKRFGTRAIYQTLIMFMKEQLKEGGLFDSNMLFVESQDFRRDMKGIEMAMMSIFGASRGAIRVHDSVGGSKPSNQWVSGNSAKSCYAGLFPSVAGYVCADEYEAEERTGKASVARFRHGHGDVHGGSAATKQQYARNKANSKLYGQLIAHVDDIRDVMGDDLTYHDYEEMVKHIRANKTDDIYDAMFIGLYAIQTHIYQMYRYKTQFITKPLKAIAAPPIRAKRQFEELHEFMQVMRASEASVEKVKKALFH